MTTSDILRWSVYPVIIVCFDVDSTMLIPDQLSKVTERSRCKLQPDRLVQPH